MLGKCCFSSMIVTILIYFIFVQEQIVHGLDTNPILHLCKIEFKDKDAKMKAVTECAAKQNYKLPTDLTIEAIQQEMKRLSSIDFDDSSFSKCLYESANLIKDGKVNTANFGNYFKESNISEPLLKEFTKLFEGCVKETELKFKDEKEIPCKMFTMIDYCSFNKFEEDKKHLEEICSKSDG